jgi:hypothetical protein
LLVSDKLSLTDGEVLSSEDLMYVKCIHDLFSLLSHIVIYLIVL